MSRYEPSAQGARPLVPFDARLAMRAIRRAAPLLLFGLRLWVSVSLALYVAFWLELDNAYWAGTSAAIVCQPSLGASLRKGWYRMIGTVVGAVFIVALTACFPQDRAPFLVGLALWGAGCALVATLLRNFAAYAAALAGFTAAIIASDQLGATGGPNGAAFTLAITRASEICIGIVCAGVVLAGTDFGGARSRLAAAFADLAAEITRRFTDTLTDAGANFENTQAVRRELLRRVIALDPAIDEALGESSEMRYHSAELQAAVDGLFTALAGWRALAVRFLRLPEDEARRDADTILSSVPPELRSVPDREYWIAAPARLRRACEMAVRRLIATTAVSSSLRLLTLSAADAFAGISFALNGLAWLTDDPAQRVNRRRFALRVPDWLPSLVNAARAFVTIGAVAIFWIVTGWPSGAAAITWTAIAVTLFVPQADAAYASALLFVIGNCFAVVFAAIIEFAVLPQLQTFAGLSTVIGLYLVPAGALMAQSWRRPMFIAMTANFIPLLAPANQMNYDPAQFYNGALAIVGGTGAALLAYRLLPPLSPAFRTRRLLALSLNDLRRIATKPVERPLQDWRSRIYGRLSVLPDAASPQQRAELLVALSVGTAIIRLRHVGKRLHLSGEIEEALTAFARGNGSIAAERLAELGQRLASRSSPAGLRARSLILVISEALAQHSSYLAAGERA